MSKLTREDMSKTWEITSLASVDAVLDVLDVLWSNFQEHTAECVAEAVAEAIKNRYEIGEYVQLLNAGNWHSAIVGAKNLEVNVVRFEPDHVRRPPKTRPMTDKELRDCFQDDALDASDVVRLSRPTLEAMAKDLGVSIEVEVD